MSCRGSPAFVSVMLLPGSVKLLLLLPWPHLPSHFRQRSEAGSLVPPEPDACLPIRSSSLAPLSVDLGCAWQQVKWY